MASKVQRQQTISRLIGAHGVTNQPQLVDLLADQGIAATQATVSRDLEVLGAVKVRVPGGIGYTLKFTVASAANVPKEPIISLPISRPATFLTTMPPV